MRRILYWDRIPTFARVTAGGFEPCDDIEMMPEMMKRLNVGCGPHHRREGWHNIDIQQFPSVDEVRDATLPFDDLAPLEYIYSEHFLEHLPLAGAIDFLRNSADALSPKGRFRLSTPSLEHVLSTHFDIGTIADEKRILDTFAINRAFHGWSHQFLWSKPMLERVLLAVGFERVEFCPFGVSDDPILDGMERHGTCSVVNGYPSVWTLEAFRDESLLQIDRAFLDTVEIQYLRYVRGNQ